MVNMMVTESDYDVEWQWLCRWNIVNLKVTDGDHDGVIVNMILSDESGGEWMNLIVNDIADEW